ncbi:alanine--tRNA ligase [Mobiluncus mulieris]|uniref:alanine--tRNA ligase n=1 Tax=Mobiluncus mulieris TaxID=2052 RepID=UPI0014703B4B|nr:alanine--tRNA ligase [Mobiluncus mulieris]NMX11092.1 alanine--tRNA ligase [Mobiluncus mulieris]
MRTAEIRQRWLDYFAANGHEVRPSVSLISPDPSILFTIAGMVPFIPYIVGTETAPWPRATSVQKCIRTNDIDEVGKTTRHGTFFQMCGNFSFGDYFKEGASKYAWDLLTGSIAEGKYGLDGDKIWVTIWEEDQEAWRIWTKEIGLDPTHIQKLPREEIFWDTGQPGPAGACAEIHYDRGSDYGPDGGPEVDAQGDRFLELWNLVFDEFLRGEGKGKNYPLLGKLDQTAIDTGLGLERLAFLLQDKDNMYEIDEVFPVIQVAQELSGRKYTSSAEAMDVHFRVVADHVRSALMLIGDGVRPSNEGRGYVLRRLMRRAVRSMRLLGVQEAVMPQLLPASMHVMKDSYPELQSNWDTISDVAYAEEDAFRRTLDAGTVILDTAVAKAKAAGVALSGEDAFQLHDTYGFPLSLTLEIAAEAKVKVDEKRFTELMNEQKQRARADAVAKKTGHVDAHVYKELAEKLGKTKTVEFLGYTETSAPAKVIGILQDGKPVPAASAPATIEVLLDRTPFYAEAGGQLADQGRITLAGGGVFDVADVQAPVKGLPMHRGTLHEGGITLGEDAQATIDIERRGAIARAHTSTHVIHQLLLDRLGDGATQAGSEDAPWHVRFDFRNSKPLSNEMLQDVEAEANERLRANLEVIDYEMPIEEARKTGAQAIFGEKYGKIVRIVDIGDGWSKEFCGGTHVPLTGAIGSLMVLSEGSVGSGVRRIEALVGDGAAGYQAKEHALVSQVTQLVGARPEDLVERITSMMERLKAAEKELEKTRLAALLSNLDNYVASAQNICGTKFICQSVSAGSVDDLRQAATQLRGRFSKTESVVVALGAKIKEKPMMVVATNEAAREKGVKAGALVKAGAAAMQGGGGGKDDLAQGGGAPGGSLENGLKAATTELQQALR